MCSSLWGFIYDCLTELIVLVSDQKRVGALCSKSDWRPSSLLGVEAGSVGARAPRC